MGAIKFFDDDGKSQTGTQSLINIFNKTNRVNKKKHQ